ncbi:MAG: hypothetical protein HYU86_12955 [Chloroflexi bacterium]|nr:hypothetical protein [Chloroflexota bacterium]
MYGTVARIRVKTGQESVLIAKLQQWNKERKPKVKGAIAGYLFRLDSDPQDMIMVAVFQDKDTYLANADDPEQDRWYREMRQHLEADPIWQDGEIVST